MSFDDQRAAELLAICNDIGEAAYLDSQVAACLIEIVRRLPSKQSTLPRLAARYGFELEDSMTGWLLALSSKNHTLGLNCEPLQCRAFVGLLYHVICRRRKTIEVKNYC